MLSATVNLPAAARRLDGDGPRAKQHRFIRGEVDDGRFDAVAARATVQHQRDGVSELLGDMSRIRRTDAAKTVGGRCGNAVTAEDEQSRQQRVRDRVSGNAQADAVLAAGHDIEYGRGAR